LVLDAQFCRAGAHCVDDQVQSSDETKKGVINIYGWLNGGDLGGIESNPIIGRNEKKGSTHTGPYGWLWLNGGDLGGIEPLEGVQQELLQLPLLLFAGEEGRRVVAGGGGMEGGRRGVNDGGGLLAAVEGPTDGGGRRGAQAGVVGLGGGGRVEVQGGLVVGRRLAVTLTLAKMMMTLATTTIAAWQRSGTSNLYC